MAIVSRFLLCFSALCAMIIAFSRRCVKLKIVQLKNVSWDHLLSVPFCLFWSCFWTQGCILCMASKKLLVDPIIKCFGKAWQPMCSCTSHRHIIKINITHMTPIHEYIYSVLYIWKYICGIHTYTQHIKFCSHNQIIYPRRDSTWIQSTHKHNLFSTARVTYNGQQRRYRRGLQSGLPREFIIEGSENHRECFMAKPALCYPASYLFCEYFMSCLIYRSVIIFCAVLSLAFRAECVVYMKSERIFSFLWWKVKWSLYINCIKCEFATKMIEDFDRAH